MRADLSKAHDADIACPLSTSIFARIAAEAALEELAQGKPVDQVTPFWRVIDEKSPLARRLSCGPDFIEMRRRRERPAKESGAMPKVDAFDALFDNKDPVVRDIYARLFKALSKLGPFEAEPKKTSIHLVHGTAFAGAHPKKAWLDVTIRTDAPLSGERIRAQEQVSKSRWHQDVRLASPKDVDQQLVSWLKAAYALTA